MQNRFYLYALVAAAFGLCAAALIHLTAGESADEWDGYRVVIVDGKVYPIPLAGTKMYRRELERFGGKAALLFDDINRRFAGLWRGKSLAITVLWIAGFITLALFLLGRHASSDAESDTRTEGNKNEIT